MYYHNTAVNMKVGARISTLQDSRCHDLPVDVYEAPVQYLIIYKSSSAAAVAVK